MFEKIRDIIVAQLGLDDKDGLSMETSFKEDLDADSLDAVEVIMGLEEEFDIEIPDEDAENFKTIGDVVEYIENR
ncbi:acyl carrier protein [Terrisporobacter petrolearius]|uniref:acyl carrier protein n=1 Tax=Terrisporobacter petrolearius TaxID=1460447 RepID=UPI0031CCCF7F